MPFPLPAVFSQHARRLFLLQGSHPFLGRPFFLPTCFALRRASRPPACTHARSRTHGRQTNERRDGRSAGVADWITALGGNTERTLTAAAGPSPRDPYRHAFTMRSPLKVRPLVFFDLETHLMHYALDPNCTLFLMGDVNIDLCTRDDDDGPALRPLRKLLMGLPKNRLVFDASDGDEHAAAGLWIGSDASTDGASVVKSSLDTMMATRGQTARSSLSRQVLKTSGPNIAAIILPVWMSIIVLFA